MTTTTDVLRQYARAMEHDWPAWAAGARVDLLVLADVIDRHGTVTLAADDLAALRASLDLCPDGAGHWTIHCRTSLPT